MKRIVSALLITTVAIGLIGCGSAPKQNATVSPEITPEASASVTMEPYQTPKGYSTYELNGYKFDCPDAWGEPNTSDSTPTLAFRPSESDAVFVNIDKPDSYKFYQGKVDDEFLENASHSMSDIGLKDISGVSTGTLDTAHGIHCYIAVRADDDGVYNEYVTDLGDYIFHVYYGTSNIDSDLLMENSDVMLNIIDSVRK